MLNKNNGLSLNGFDPVLGGLGGSGNLNLGARTLTIDGVSQQDYTGVLSGTGGLAMTSGRFTMKGLATYSGGTNLSGGALNLSATTSISALEDNVSMSGSAQLVLMDAASQDIGSINISSAATATVLRLAGGSTLQLGDSSDWLFPGFLQSDSAMG